MLKKERMFYISALGFVFGVCLPGMSQTRPSPEESKTYEERNTQAIDVYRAVWETWNAEVSYKGDYIVVSSIEQNLPVGSLANYREIAGQISDQGRIFKLREWVRLETSPPDPLKEALLPDGTTGYTNLPCTSITNGQVDLDHFFDPRDAPDSARLTEFVTVKHRQSDGRNESSPKSTMAVLSPLTLGMPSLKIFELPLTKASGKVEYEESIVKYSATQKAVSLTRNDPDGSHFEKKIHFDESYSPPRLTSVMLVIQSQGMTTFADVHLDDFVVCGEHFAPRSVTQQVSNSIDGRSLVRQWRSKNLGELQPTQSDFILEVEKDVQINGIRQLPPVIDGKRFIDLASIADSLIVDGPQPLSEIIDPSAPTQTAPLPKDWKAWLIWLNVIVVIVIGWIAFRRRKAGH